MAEWPRSVCNPWAATHVSKDATPHPYTSTSDAVHAWLARAASAGQCVCALRLDPSMGEEPK
eukprot:6603507-Pyramimonas_sp.AAC.1